VKQGAITCNEGLYSLNKSEELIFAIVEIMEDEVYRFYYVRRQPQEDSEFGFAGASYYPDELNSRREERS
jgi:hypothetical protein